MYNFAFFEKFPSKLPKFIQFSMIKNSFDDEDVLKDMNPDDFEENLFAPIESTINLLLHFNTRDIIVGFSDKDIKEIQQHIAFLQSTEKEGKFRLSNAHKILIKKFRQQVIGDDVKAAIPKKEKV